MTHEPPPNGVRRLFQDTFGPTLHPGSFAVLRGCHFAQETP